MNPVQELSGASILANILPGLGIDEFFTRTDVGNFSDEELVQAFADAGLMVPPAQRAKGEKVKKAL